MWFLWGFLAVAAVAVVMAVMKPSMKRKQAIATALANARARVAASPGDLDAQVSLAGVHVNLTKDNEAARAALEGVLAKEPLHWARGNKPTRMLVADVEVARGKLDVAIAALEEFLAKYPEYQARTGGDAEQKWRLETCKVEAEQRVRMLKKGDTHLHAPEKWGDTEED